MAIKFQYNKTALQSLDKQLKVRVRALPTIKNKESALRVEVKKARIVAEDFDKKLVDVINAQEKELALWNEYSGNILSISNVELGIKKIAGVKVPILNNIDFDIADFSMFNSPQWFLDGIEELKKLVEIAIEREVFIRKMELLNKARKKTTQKVNLYEKVQIPGYENAILKIKRFLEDSENLSKSSQKIVKTRKLMEDMS
ncbi:V-type ATP synthase subunit D [Marinilabiliaceae bacterium JC040]|nr:V-type ATP synthase subunit D [Marinilabiliaceae bacterium JC040]